MWWADRREVIINILVIIIQRRMYIMSNKTVEHYKNNPNEPINISAPMDVELFRKFYETRESCFVELEIKINGESFFNENCAIVKTESKMESDNIQVYCSEVTKWSEVCATTLPTVLEALRETEDIAATFQLA